MHDVTASNLPPHLLPSSCHVCGSVVPKREGATRPDCWHDLTNAEALAAAEELDRLTVIARSPESAYVAEHRPY